MSKVCSITNAALSKAVRFTVAVSQEKGRHRPAVTKVAPHFHAKLEKEGASGQGETQALCKGDAFDPRT